MNDDFLKAKDILKKYNQEHVLNFYDKLSEENKKKLVNQILSIDFEQINKLYENTKHEIQFGDAKIEPIDYLEKEKINSTDFEKYNEIGTDIIKQGKLAVVTMAGGQGTRLGHKGPKGTYDLGLESHKSIFEILCDTLKLAKNNYGTYIQWYIMTSEENKIGRAHV